MQRIETLIQALVRGLKETGYITPWEASGYTGVAIFGHALRTPL